MSRDQAPTVDLDKAREALSRLIKVAFRKTDENGEPVRPRFCIPRRPDDDDAILGAALDELAALRGAAQRTKEAVCTVCKRPWGDGKAHLPCFHEENPGTNEGVPPMNRCARRKQVEGLGNVQCLRLSCHTGDCDFPRLYVPGTDPAFESWAKTDAENDRRRAEALAQRTDSASPAIQEEAFAYLGNQATDAEVHQLAQFVAKCIERHAPRTEPPKNWQALYRQCVGQLAALATLVGNEAGDPEVTLSLVRDLVASRKGPHDREDCPCGHPIGTQGPCAGCNCADDEACRESPKAEEPTFEEIHAACIDTTESLRDELGAMRIERNRFRKEVVTINKALARAQEREAEKDMRWASLFSETSKLRVVFEAAREAWSDYKEDPKNDVVIERSMNDLAEALFGAPSMPAPTQEEA